MMVEDNQWAIQDETLNKKELRPDQYYYLFIFPTFLTRHNKAARRTSARQYMVSTVRTYG